MMKFGMGGRVMKMMKFGMGGRVMKMMKFGMGGRVMKICHESLCSFKIVAAMSDVLLATLNHHKTLSV